MPTTFVADLRDGVKAILDAQIAATPTLLRAAYRYRPGGFGETPAAYIAGIRERVAHDSGLRRREVEITVTVVDVFPTENVPDDPMDQLRDALLDRFTDNPSIVPVTRLEVTGIADGEIDQPGSSGATVVYRGLSYTLSGVIQEGRS
jgi:hypothetical protein